MATCANCGTESAPGKKFCAECGSALQASCPSCGNAVSPNAKFCEDCGTALGATPAPVGVIEQPVAERRVVSVLFADLVGFTTLSEGRDPEEVRELLSRYFETSRSLIERYGGTVEKFIGDAVMAVWGVPAATEDDAERAVRAALDLVASVAGLGEDVGADLRARAGVLTGEAAVTVGATGQGMVAGDLVNTASRVQSVAEPGSVFVGDETRRTTDLTVVYEPAGAFSLKGKDGEVELWRALRVVSGRAGSLKSTGLEAPFVGRERELRQIKELFHACAEERRAQLVSVTGIAGIGKSRLVWEFYKYFDGIEQTIYWHRGRCLSYGESVTYWALADMVRMRCGIAEDEEPETARRKLAAALEEHILDLEERRYIEPRLAQLLGLGDQAGAERQDLHGAWRLFFERLSDAYPVVLAFEDMQWADSSLLDFVEHLLDWSRNHPIYVLTLARPELLERRQGWGAGQRNFASIYLEPLSEIAMTELLGGLVPGLPPALRDRILERAEGVPLYAVETVRMLLDRGLLELEGSSYRVVGEVETLDVPGSLQALAAARLDGLAADERRVVQDGAVLGKTFTVAALTALTGRDDAALEPILQGLVRKEVLGVQTDPRSPEHGQYGFLQDLLRQVAYDMLARRDRREKHLAAAGYLAATLGDEEVAEVIASHLLDAYRLEPDHPEAATLREQARQALLGAAERAASLGATTQAWRQYEQAADLGERPADEAEAAYLAGRMAVRSGADVEDIAPLYERAENCFLRAGDRLGAARAGGRRGSLEAMSGNYERAIALREAALEAIADEEPGFDHVEALLAVGDSYFFTGQPEAAVDRVERALEIAEALGDSELLCRGWTSKASFVQPTRPEEARGLYQLALDRALDDDIVLWAVTPCQSLADLSFHRDRYAEAAAYLEQSRGLCRRVGDRRSEWFSLSELTYALTMLGRWEEALARLAEIPEEQLSRNATLLSPATGPLEIHLARGELDQARAVFAHYEQYGASDDFQARSGYLAASSALRLAEGRPREALEAAEQAIAARDHFGIGSQAVKQGYRHGLEAALLLGEPDTAARLLEVVDETPPGLTPPFLRALAARYRARLAGEQAAAEVYYAAAVKGFDECELPFDEAVVSLELGEWLVGQGRATDAEPQLEHARDTFDRLGAKPWLERAFAAERRDLVST